jgi:dihydropteroate synthase
MSFWSDKSTPFSGIKILKCGDFVLNTDKPLVMGILNLTPDSFFDGGRYTKKDAWMSQTEKMIEDGASIIDLGAVSTRPGAEIVSEKEEISRLMPAVELLCAKYPGTVFSVDTYRANVVKLTASAGAGIINDISGGSLDAGLIAAVAETRLPYILMHMQGTPAVMQKNPVYSDVTNEVNDFFEQSLASLHQAGIQQVILDPGFGFGKSIQHNYKMLRELSVFKQYNCPVLVGISRKSMIYKLLEITPEDALPATSAMHMVALINGADILRVHDVKEAMQVIRMAGMFGEREIGKRK